LEGAHAVALLAKDDASVGVAAADAEGFLQAGELVGIVEGGDEGAAHEEYRDEAGQHRAAEPAQADGMPCRRLLLGIVAERKGRLVAEFDGAGDRIAGQGDVSRRPPHGLLVSPMTLSPTAAMPRAASADAGR